MTHSGETSGGQTNQGQQHTGGSQGQGQGGQGQRQGQGGQGQGRGGQQTGVTGVGSDIATWFAASALRIGIALIGFIVLLVALGQLVGMNLLGFVADALTSGVGRWIAVAIFAILLIALALRGFGMTRA